MRTLNLGILAHVDAGKTTLTERLLFAAGVIDEVGSVDHGNTKTDSLALERERGITIKSAVVSFVIEDVTINLIDTPGHPDFIAEVERVLNVLDGAVLVVSAVEGVQAQTRLLMRTLQRLRVPTLLFVNKIDRAGASVERVLSQIMDRLTPTAVSMGVTRQLGSRRADVVPFGDDAGFMRRLADVLAEHDDEILAAVVDGSSVPERRLHEELIAQTGRALVHPVFFGSALTGAGVEAVKNGIVSLLPATDGDGDGELSGTVFKIERGTAVERIAYVRLFSGSLRVRDRVRCGDGEHKVTAIRVFERGDAVTRPSARAGEIAQLWGLRDARIGDEIGRHRATMEYRFAPPTLFDPPTLETVVVPRDASDAGALYAALAQLAEQDPLINLRQDDLRHELSLSLYGEVQKEVIEATLLREYGLEVGFRETTMICVERPTGAGDAVEEIGDGNPFFATVGLRIEPAIDPGVTFRLEAALDTIPLYVFSSVEAFRSAMEAYVDATLREGLLGWRVVDFTVTMTRAGYVPPLTGRRDFKYLTPLVLMNALQRAGTAVCEPIHRFHIEAPSDMIGVVLQALARLDAAPRDVSGSGSMSQLEGVIAATNVRALQQRLPALTRGEGVLTTAFDHYRPMRGEPPSRPRTDRDPRNRELYLRHLFHGFEGPG